MGDKNPKKNINYQKMSRKSEDKSSRGYSVVYGKPCDNKCIKDDDDDTRRSGDIGPRRSGDLGPRRGGIRCHQGPFPRSDRGRPRPYLPTVTSTMKWWLAIFLGFLFFLIAYGGTYNFTNCVWTSAGLPSYLCAPGCPNICGVIIHAIIFVLIIRLILW